MDIFAHSLWVVAGAKLARRHRIIVGRGTIVAGAVLAALPDVVHMVPVISWALLGSGSIADLRAYAVAVPGGEPAMPMMVELLAHHLHCMMHSAIVAGAATLLVLMVNRSVWFPLLAWWSHIVIDVFTHSDDYYPSPVLYPITYSGFDGLAWNRPGFLAVNYTLLIAVYAWLYYASRRKERI